jgi:glycosyltransferase involved in cell wall biosynthesis
MIVVDLRFFNGAYKGGVFNIVLSFINAAATANHRVVCLVRSSLIISILQQDIHSCDIEYEVFPIIINYPLDTLLLGSLFISRRADYVFWPWYFCPIIRLSSFKSVLGLWDISPISHSSSYQFPKNFLLPIAFRISALSSTSILSCSMYDVLQIQKYIKPRVPVTYLPLPIDKSRFFSRTPIVDNPNNVTTENSCLNRTFRFVSYGNIYDRRLIPLVLEALDHLDKSHCVQFEFFLVGNDATQKQIISQLCSSYSYPIIRHDYLDQQELSDVLSTADLGICLSDQDGTSYIILEYALLRVPVLTSSLMAGELDHNCLCVSPHTTPAEVAQKIRSFLSGSNTDLYANMVSRAFDHVVANFPDASDSSILKFFNLS